MHSNGFSLVRSILKKHKIKKNLKKDLLKPTKIYTQEILKLVDKNLINSAAHITGGGLIENITRSIPENIYVCDLTIETIEKIFGEVTIENDPLGNDPKTNEPIWIKNGPYGHYVQVGESKTRKGIPKNYPVLEVNLAYALELLSLPRNVGMHPEDAEMITADYGRYGPYIKCGKKNAPLRGQETPLDVTLEKSIELLANRKTQSNDIKSLGKHPKSGKNITVKTGRYGPYVSDGKVNASLKGDINPESITLDEAAELINQRIANPPKKRRKTKKK